MIICCVNKSVYFSVVKCPSQCFDSNYLKKNKFKGSFYLYKLIYCYQTLNSQILLILVSTSKIQTIMKNTISSPHTVWQYKYMQFLIYCLHDGSYVSFDEYIKAFPPWKQPSSFILSLHFTASQSDAPCFIKTPCLVAQRIWKLARSLHLYSLSL